MHRLTIPDEAAGERLDRTLAGLIPDLSRSKIQRLIRDGLVAVDGAIATKGSRPVEPAQEITVEVPADDARDRPRPQAIELDVLFEDDDLVVINKAVGLVVHAGAGAHDATVVNALLHRYGDGLSKLGGDERPGIVHRLDKGTSGAMAVARNDRAHEALSAQFAARTVDKEYLALVYGCPRETSGEIDLALGRDRGDRKRISPDTDKPRDALTRWQLAEELAGFALLFVRPKTGRMHQVRAHLTAIHHPCIGDAMYGGSPWRGIQAGWLRKVARDFGRPALHARKLCLDHPISGERMEFATPPPADFEELLEALRRWRQDQLSP